MVLKTAPLKVKLTKEDGSSELRRLGFSFDNSMVATNPLGRRVQAEGYHLSLVKFLLRSLADLYPHLPVGGFSSNAVFTVMDEDGDMVRFDSEEEFVAALPGFESWKSCLRIEVTVLKSAPLAPAPADVSAGAAQPPAGAIAQQADTETERSAISEAAPSESGSMLSSFSDFPGPSTTISLSNLPAPPRVPTAIAGETATVPAVPASLPMEPEVPHPAPSPSGSIASAAQSAASGDTCQTPAAQAKAFLSQVLPSLADVLARSMYAAQMMPNTGVTQASQTAARTTEGDFGSTAAGLAAAAATAAATAASVASSGGSLTENVPVPMVSPVVATANAAPEATIHTPAADKLPTATAPALASSPAPTPANVAPAAPETNSQVVHTGVVCDGCEISPIVGTRYKCAVRSDFDLCEACEAVAGPDSPFPFLKIRTPAQVPSAIVCLLRPDQPASVEEASTFKIPRSGGPGWKSHAHGQSWRTRTSPQRGGWGEGRRNAPRWKKDLARRQHQQFVPGMGSMAPGVEVVRFGRSPWCGPRMQQRRKEEETAAPENVDKEAEEDPVKKTKAEDDVAEDVTPPASVESSIHDVASIASAVEAIVVPAPTEDAFPQTEAAPEVVGGAEKDQVEKPTKEASNKLAVPAVTDSSQSLDYHDLLAASMRSLASSMSASHPVPTAPQEKARGFTPAGETGKPQGKPMARFVTDVSVVDGSPLPPNTRFVKTWCMRNDGAVIFPPGCKLMPVGGDLMSGPEDGVPVEQRAPGEEFHVSVTLTTPNQSGRYIGYWRLRTAEGQNFGHRVWADVLVTGGTADLMAEGTMDGDWDLVNMQRLTKAVEDTARDGQIASADAATVATPTPDPSITSIPAESRDTSSAEHEAQAASENPFAHDDASSGIDESKSSDEPPSQKALPEQKAPSPAVTKWHRELCSLAEMGFENTARNIALLEKHVIAPGNPGMERVLHELLSWHEVVIS